MIKLRGNTDLEMHKKLSQFVDSGEKDAEKAKRKECVRASPRHD